MKICMGGSRIAQNENSGNSRIAPTVIVIKKILKTIYYLVLAGIAAIALLLIFSIFPIKGNYKTLVVLSGSMEPKIKMGSVVAVKPMDDYKVGDVVTFGEMSKTKTPTTHRIYEIREDGGQKSFITKGDANNAPDQKPVKQDEIIGKVLFSVPYAGYGVAATRKPLGFVLIIVVPAVIIIYEEIRSIKNEIRRMINKRRGDSRIAQRGEGKDEETKI